MVGFFIASMIRIYSPRIASIIVTDKVPLVGAGRYLETGTQDGSFCDAVRTRDRRCVITDDPVRMAQAGRWRGFDSCHIFPLAYKGKCSVRNGAVRPFWARTRTDDISSSRPGNSRTRTDYILPSRLLVRGSWQSPRRALRGPRTAENTGKMERTWVRWFVQSLHQ